MIIHNPILTGSFSVNGADLSTITGSVATSASFDARTTYLESTSSILTAASASQSVTSGSLVAASASLSATSGSLSAASGSFNTRVSALEATGSALSSSLLTVSGSGYATSGSLNTRVSALEATGSALSSSLLTVSGSGYATSASLSAASGSFNSRVATIESKYATTGSNTFIGTQVVSGSILQSGSFTSTGTLTAQTLVIQTITSSVVYSSGSNVFGNSLGNSQVFTGSVLITGSLALAGNITSNGTAVVLGSGTSSYLPKFTGTSTIGNSILSENNNEIIINVADPTLVFNGSRDYALQSNNTSGNFRLIDNTAGLARLTLDTSGNLGLGVTPSAWGSGLTAMQVLRGSLLHDGSNYYAMPNNAYFDGTNWIYIGTTFASNYAQVNGSHQWFQAPSGTAGNAITFTQAMTLLANGNLGIGINAPDVKLDVVGTNRIQLRTDDTIPEIRSITPNGSAFKEFGLNGLELRFYISSTERMRIWTSTGNVNIGTTPASDSGYKLDVNGTGRFTGSLQVGSGGGGTGTATQSVFQDTYGGLRSVIYVRNTADYAAGRGSGYSIQNGEGVEKASLQIRSNDASQTGYFLELVNVGAGSLTIASTGAATFSSSVTTGSPITIQAAAPYIEWKNVASTRLGYIQHNATNLIYNADTGVHVFNQAATFSSSVHKLNIISLGGVFSTGTSGVACRSIETAYALASCRTSVTKGVQYANGSWYNLFYASQDVYMHYKILLTCASYFAVSAQASNAQDGTDRTFKVQYSYNNGGTWCDSFGATFGAGNGQGTGVISVDQSNAQLIGVRIGFCNGSGSTIIGFTCLAFQSCSLGMTIMNSLG